MARSVKGIMSTNIVTVGLDDTLARVHQLFSEHGFHHVLVVENGRLQGVLSDRDLLRTARPFLGRTTALEADQLALSIPARDVISRSLVTTTADTSIPEAARAMLRENVTCLPVVAEDGQVEGIVTVRDMLRHVVRSAEGELPE